MHWPSVPVDARRTGLIARVLGVVALMSAWFWVPPLLRPLSFFAVRRVDVVGARYFDPSAVVAAMALRPEASVFDDADDVEQRLMAMPGIASADITRLLPGTLRVTIVAVEPVALAESRAGLVPLGRDARPLPYDMATSPVDAPIVRDAGPRLLEALTEVQATDPGLYADVASARATGSQVVLDMAEGRVRLDMPVDRSIVEAVSAVRRDLESRGVDWQELDGRFRGWVVVRRAERPGIGNRESGIAGTSARRPASAATRAPARRPAPAPPRSRNRAVIPDSRFPIPGLS